MEHLPLLHHPIDAIVFDCDSTLSKLEGIDEIAKLNGQGEQVHVMTERAMNETGVDHHLYKQRLDLVKPKQEQMSILGDLYYQHRTQDAETTIQFLKELDKKIFIISAGLLPAVQGYGARLGVAKSAIYAVDIYFDEQGNYTHFEEDSILTTQVGKRDIIEDLIEFYPRIIHVGDGLNDVASRDVVTRFIGFGGVSARPHIAAMSDYYVTHPSLLSVLPLCLTHEETTELNQEQFALFQQGVKYLQKWEHHHE